MTGGRSERFWPVNGVMEKSMLPTPSGKPIIREIYERVTAADSPYQPQDVVVLCHSTREKVFQHEFRDTPVQVHGSTRYLGTLGHLLLAMKDIESSDYLVHYTDMVTDINYDRLQSYHDSQNVAGTIVTYKVQSPYSDMDISKGKITRFSEKPWVASPIWTGVGLFEASIVEFMANTSKEGYIEEPDIGHDLLPALAVNGQLAAYNHTGEWMDVGNVQQYIKWMKSNGSSGSPSQA